MVTSTAKFSYSDCFEVMDAALADDRGARASFPTEGGAMQFRVRVHTARQMDRDANGKTYPADHPMHGISEYDKLTARIRQEDGMWWVYLEHTPTYSSVEPLTPTEEAAQ